MSARGAIYEVRQACGLTHVFAADELTGRMVALTLDELRPPPSDVSPAGPLVPRPDLLDFPEHLWRVARARLDVITPLLEAERRSSAAVAAAAASADRLATTGRAGGQGVTSMTVYRWLRAYERDQLLSSLIPGFAQRGSRATKLRAEAEAIIASAAADLPAEHRRRGAPPPTVEQIHERVVQLCGHAGLTPPHRNTTRQRLQQLRAATRRASPRGGGGRGPAAGQFPGADYPLAVVQIDHTPMDLECVHDVNREPVGRPWLTVAIDVFSRTILGFYVAVDAPSAARLGRCLVQAILRKDGWMAARKIAGEWPCWGRPHKVHVDNGSDFQSQWFVRACEEYRMGLEYRPVGKPEYGAHIERFIGHAVSKLHKLPGTTFSNPQQRGDYDSRANARLTVADVERYLGTWITGVYHKRPHAGLGGVAPLERWEQGLTVGVGDRPPTGLPPVEADPARLSIDFLPYVERIVQADGVHVDHIRYFSDVLRRFGPASHAAGAPSPKLRFRIDPGDRSALFFRPDAASDYYKIPYAHTNHPTGVSAQSIGAAKRKLRAEHRAVDEAAIMATVKAMRQQVDDAITATKRSVRANRDAQRQLDYERSRSASQAVPTPVRTFEHDAPPTAAADETTSGSTVPHAAEPDVRSLWYDDLDGSPLGLDGP